MGKAGRYYTEVDLEELMKKFSDESKRYIDSAFNAGYEKHKQDMKYFFKQTERKLYSYPELKDNVKKYNLDIQDLEREKITGRSKDIVRIPEGNGIRLSPEEIQEAKIMVIQKKIERDQAEIKEIERALDSIRNDAYYMIVEYKYFDAYDDDRIAETMHCDERTVRRHKSRLVSKVSVKLFGADVCAQRSS